MEQSEHRNNTEHYYCSGSYNGVFMEVDGLKQEGLGLAMSFAVMVKNLIQERFLQISMPANLAVKIIPMSHRNRPHP